MDKPTPTLDKLKSLVDIIKNLIISKHWGTIIVKLENGNIPHCEMRKNIKLE